jgi:hypothetical protein
MRFLIAVLGTYGLYRLFIRRRGRRRPRPLLQDMRGRTGRRDGGLWGERPEERVTYEIVEHDCGWAYKVGDVFSESYALRSEAVRAAEYAAEAHRSAGEDEVIEYQDREGRWHEEMERGDHRPETRVAPRSESRH